MRMGEKRNCVAVLQHRQKTIGDLNKYIWIFGRINVNFCLCEWETKEIVSVNMCLLDIHHHHHDTEPF